MLIRLSLLLLLIYSAQLSFAQGVKKTTDYQPVVDGEWWDIIGNPDLGKYTSQKQEPVDFGVWQAKDGTWQLWSCIRNTNAGGKTRLFYRWEGKNLTDRNWEPKGIAMESDTTLGEEKSGLQAPYVFIENGVYYLFYGDWNNICLAKSEDGKNFKRVLNDKNTAALFSGPMYNTRDPMVIKIKDTYYCYYSAHLKKNTNDGGPKGAIFCRTSKNMRDWSEAVEVSKGGTPLSQTRWYAGDIECPFVVKIKGKYILFRNHLYGKNQMNTQYCSSDPLNFGINSDEFMVSQIPVAAPEIIKIKSQYYIVSLKPTLDGIKMAKLKFVKN